MKRFPLFRSMTALGASLTFTLALVGCGETTENKGTDTPVKSSPAPAKPEVKPEPKPEVKPVVPTPEVKPVVPTPEVKPAPAPEVKPEVKAAPPELTAPKDAAPKKDEGAKPK